MNKHVHRIRETEPVTPVDPAVVEATPLYLPPYVADMVRVQLLTGARPGEVGAMCVRDLDMPGAVWSYRPEGHKNAWRSHDRAIAIGPTAQAILRRYITPRLDARLFSPKVQDALIKAQKRAARKTKVQPSQQDRSKPRAGRKPRDFFP
jgi:integrase